MELEKQVCSLDLAKRLKELRVEQESLFWWIAPEDSAKWPAKLVYKTGLGAYYQNGAGVNEKTFELAPVLISAFTVAELGEMLPPVVNYRRRAGYKNGDGKDEWAASYYPQPRTLHAPTEADARAKMLIYLLEQKLIIV